MSDEQTCQGCGASFETTKTECPYCGRGVVRRVTSPSIDGDSRDYSLDRESGTVHFGNGETGRRLPSGGENIRARYRAGAGSEGVITCPKCRTKQSIVKGKCSRCGTRLKKGKRKRF